MSEEKIIIDGKEGILGRVASYAAKKSLLGKSIIIVNCNESLIIGSKKNVLEKYKRIRRIGGSSLKGPKFQKTPERIMKRTIRGMLPHKQERGRVALKRIRCYNTLPNEYSEPEKISLKRNTVGKTIKLSELSKEL